jgi:hypothetical protein
MPPEFWEGAEIGKYYRPLKTQISFRIDNEILDWLKSKGEGHLTRINEIFAGADGGRQAPKIAWRGGRFRLSHPLQSGNADGVTLNAREHTPEDDAMKRQHGVPVD